MSAFIVSTDHIDALVTYCVTKGLSARNPTEIGQIFLTENYRSVGYRYSEPASNQPAAYRFRSFTKPLSAVAILKACDCLEYQSCEHDQWGDSVAKSLLDSIRTVATRHVPGYGDAQWEISR